MTFTDHSTRGIHYFAQNYTKKICLSFRSWRQLAGETGTCGKILNRPKEMNASCLQLIKDRHIFWV
jgi:hypothetical protein